MLQELTMAVRLTSGGPSRATARRRARLVKNGHPVNLRARRSRFPGLICSQRPLSLFLALAVAASLLTELMRAFEEEKQVRRGVSLWYAEKFEGIPKFRKPPKPDFPYLRYPLFIEEKNLRDRMLTELMACGTGATLFYPFPLNRLPGLEKKLQDSSVYPNAQNLSETLIALPVHSGVSASHRQKILDIVKQEM